MLSDNPFLLYALLDPERYENIDRYRPTEEYSSIVAALPASGGWELAPGGFWSQWTPPGFAFRRHGWKIHLSALPSDAGELLRRAVPVLLDERVAFKHCSDPWMLELSLSKNWSRSQSGKFVTVYPSDDDSFVRSVERLHAATAGLKGPFVLTDRPYRDSGVVFYRYGEHQGLVRPTPRGQLERGFPAPDGTWWVDDRAPCFRLPPWVDDPFSDHLPPQAPGPGGVLLAGRYRITGVLKFNAVGGIYSGTDESTGEPVVVREARLGLGSGGTAGDACQLLRNEARLLQRLAGTGAVPRFVDLFCEWEHLFLVQELVGGESLWGYSMGFYFASPEQSPADAFEAFSRTALTIAKSLQRVHDEGIVLRDLTKSNVLMTEAGEARFIDLEFAYEIGSDQPPVHAWTAGYASLEQLLNREPSPSDDHYAFGALVLDMLTYGASGFELNRAGIFRMLRRTLTDLRLPLGIEALVRGLTELDPARRWDLGRAVHWLERIPPPAGRRPLFAVGDRPPPRRAPSRRTIDALERTVAGIGDHLLAAADHDRQDRLWPASAEVFVTNPVSLQYGAAGPALFLLQSRGEVPARSLDWIETRTDPALCPPGLMSGLAGVALLLLLAGRRGRAEELMEASWRPEAVLEVPGFYYGAAGWGIASLSFWQRSGDIRHLQRASEVAELLLASARHDAQGVSWASEGSVALGLGEGASGVALFLLFLYAVVGEPRLLETAVRAVDFDLAHRQEVAGSLLWQPRTDSSSGAPRSPHMWFGSAGVGTAALRCWLATGERRYLRFAERCAVSTSSRFTNKLWHDFGIAGYGEYLLDMDRLVGGAEYRANAFHLAEALLPHRLAREGGIAFPGQDLFRLCCDFGSGSAGIGCFLLRLLRGGPRLLMLDELLTANGAAVAFRGTPGRGLTA